MGCGGKRRQPRCVRPDVSGWTTSCGPLQARRARLEGRRCRFLSGPVRRLPRSVSLRASAHASAWATLSTAAIPHGNGVGHPFGGIKRALPFDGGTVPGFSPGPFAGCFLHEPSWARRPLTEPVSGRAATATARTPDPTGQGERAGGGASVNSQNGELVVLPLTFMGERRRGSPATAGRSGVRRPSQVTTFHGLRRQAATAALRSTRC